MESVRDKNGCKVSPPKPNPVLIKNEVPEVSPKPQAEVSRFEIRNREFEMPSRYDHSFNFWVEVEIFLLWCDTMARRRKKYLGSQDGKVPNLVEFNE